MTTRQAKALNIGDQIGFKAVGWTQTIATVTEIWPTNSEGKIRIKFQCAGLTGSTTHDRLIFNPSNLTAQARRGNDDKESEKISEEDLTPRM